MSEERFSKRGLYTLQIYVPLDYEQTVRQWVQDQHGEASSLIVNYILEQVHVDSKKSENLKCSKCDGDNAKPVEFNNGLKMLLCENCIKHSKHHVKTVIP